MKRKLVAVAFAALFPVVSMLGYNEYASRQQRDMEVRQQAAQSAKQAASEMGGIIDGLHSLLIAVSTLESIRALDREPCMPTLDGVADQVPSIRTIILLDKSGKLVCDSLRSEAGQDFSDRRYFQEALEGKEFVVGELTKSRLSGQFILPVALALKVDGQTKGVLVTGLRLEWLQQRMQERGVMQGNALTIADAGGTILVHAPLPERFVGTHIPSDLKKLLHAPQPDVIEVLGEDGVAQILGYQPIGWQENRLFVSAGTSKSEAFASINRSTLFGVFSIAAGAIIALAAAVMIGNRFILNPVFLIVDVLERWRRGETSARTEMSGRDELSTVGEVVDRLLDELDRKQAEASQAEKAQELLSREIAHRTKNTLAIIQAIARQTFKRQAPEQYAAFSYRITALASGYSILFSENLIHADIYHVVEKALDPHKHQGAQQFRLHGPNVMLPPPLVLSLSLVIHELATNATKYGALRSELGQVDVDWSLQERVVILTWKETNGPAIETNVDEGFGSRLIRNAFPSTSRPFAQFTFEPTGLIFFLRFDIDTHNTA